MDSDTSLHTRPKERTPMTAAQHDPQPLPNPIPPVELRTPRRSEREEMLDGKLYNPADPELTALRERAGDLCTRFNALPRGDHETRAAVLDELLPHHGENLDILGPVFFDYGVHTTMGDRVFANFNFTVLDCAPVTIGDDVLFGPNVSLLPPMHPLRWQDRNVRKAAFTNMYEAYKKLINTIAVNYNYNTKTDVVSARIRKYGSSLEAALDGGNIPVSVYHNLISEVREYLPVVHRYMELRKKVLGVDQLKMYDVYVPLVNAPKKVIPFEQAIDIMAEGLAPLGEEYITQVRKGVSEGWIDVYEKPNKRGGAYSSGVYDVHPFVLMSFTNTKRDVSTIAHELGHSMHSYFAEKNQNILDSNYTIMIAEVASTVNEILLSEYQIVNEKDNRKKAEIIYELLEMIRATFFRQSMFAEFEKIIHEKIENGEALSSEDLNDIYYNLNQKYFGNNIIVDKEIQFEWARIPHFYSDFYVYKYATGISAAIYIANKILKHENGYLEKYIQMLSQGKAKKSIDLLKMVDVDLENVEVYDEVIKYFNEKMDILKKVL